jgi:uncharacterized membrane protein YidH (DUF202 family)
MPPWLFIKIATLLSSVQTGTSVFEAFGAKYHERSGNTSEVRQRRLKNLLVMTKSRDRSLTEVLIAVVLVCFFVGFVSVLCIGNYYRAKKAMERQRQRRLARLAGNAGNGVIGLGGAESPKSTISGASSANSTEHRNLLGTSSAISHRQTRDNGVDQLLQLS